MVTGIYLIWIDDIFKIIGISDEARVYSNKFIIWSIPSGYLKTTWETIKNYIMSSGEFTMMTKI